MHPALRLPEKPDPALLARWSEENELIQHSYLQKSMFELDSLICDYFIGGKDRSDRFHNQYTTKQLQAYNKNNLNANNN